MFTVHNVQFSSMSPYFKGQQIIHSSLTSQAYSSGLTPNTSSNSNCADSERTASCVKPLVLQLNFCWHCSSAGLCRVTARHLIDSCLKALTVRACTENMWLSSSCVSEFMCISVGECFPLLNFQNPFTVSLYRLS